MNDINTIITLLNFLGLGGIGLFIYYTFKGLNERITNLSKLAEEQRQTLDVVRERAGEYDKLSKCYKQTLEEFQEMGVKLEKRRKELVVELEEAIDRRDEKLEQVQIELKQIDLQEKSLNRFSELEEQFQNIIVDLQRQIEIITPKDTIEKYLRLYIDSNKVKCIYNESRIDIINYYNSSKDSFLEKLTVDILFDAYKNKYLKECPLNCTFCHEASNKIFEA